MNLKNIKAIIKERWKFYLVGYLVGYTLPLLVNGIHSWKSLFPVKMMGIVLSIMAGNGFYNCKKNIKVAQALEISIKATSIVLLSFLIIALVKVIILVIFGFDIIPLIGID